MSKFYEVAKAGNTGYGLFLVSLFNILISTDHFSETFGFRILTKIFDQADQRFSTWEILQPADRGYFVVSF